MIDTTKILPGQEFKNMQELSVALTGQKMPAGNRYVVRVNEMKKYFSWDKVPGSNKIIITDIFPEPVTKPRKKCKKRIVTPREYYPHGVAILNTLQQLSAAIGSSLFIGIMSATQMKALNNQVQEQTATATGFSSATLVLSGFVLVGLILSVGLTFIKNKRLVSLSDAEVVKAEVIEA